VLYDRTALRLSSSRAAAGNRPPYCIRDVAPTIAMERGLSILWIDAICGSVQNSMTPLEKNVVGRVGKPTLCERGCHRPIFHTLAEAERLRQSLLADAGRGNLAPRSVRGGAQ
jgi:hypothetical protein